MSALERLAQCAAGTQDWNGLPAGAGELTTAEIAGCLSGLPRAPYLLARAAWLGDEEVVPELEARTVVRSAGFFAPHHVVRPGLLGSMASLAVMQCINPPRCGRCGGRGVIWGRAGRVVDCGACSGSGKGPIGGDGIRRVLGLSGRAWAGMAPRYARIEALVWGWRGVAAGHVRAKLEA